MMQRCPVVLVCLATGAENTLNKRKASHRRAPSGGSINPAAVVFIVSVLGGRVVVLVGQGGPQRFGKPIYGAPDSRGGGYCASLVPLDAVHELPVLNADACRRIARIQFLAV
jgi:hypothetical protein